MPLDPKEITRAFEEVVAPDHEIIVLYSGLWSFGHRLKVPAASVPNLVLDVVREFVGPERTLIMPTFSFSFCGSRVFDLSETPSETGALTQKFLEQSDVSRTQQPLSSHAVVGPRTDEILNLSCSTSWDDNSIFGWLERQNARLCVLGVPWDDSCAFFHRAEEIAQVEYRYYKTFQGEILDGGNKIGAASETMLSRPLNVLPVWDRKNNRNAMMRMGSVSKASHPSLLLEACDARDALEAALKVLEVNPYDWIVNAEEVKSWVMSGKAEEIANLSPEEAWGRV